MVLSNLVIWVGPTCRLFQFRAWTSPKGQTSSFSVTFGICCVRLLRIKSKIATEDFKKPSRYMKCQYYEASCAPSWLSVMFWHFWKFRKLSDVLNLTVKEIDACSPLCLLRNLKMAVLTVVKTVWGFQYLLLKFSVKLMTSIVWWKAD